MNHKLEITDNGWYLKDTNDNLVAYRDNNLNLNKPRLPEPNITYTEDEVVNIVSNILYDFVDSPAEAYKILKPLLKRPIGFEVEYIDYWLWNFLTEDDKDKRVPEKEIIVNNNVLKGKYIYE